MPLEIEIHRDGEVREDVKWTEENLYCILTAVYKETQPDVKYADDKSFGALEDGQYVSFAMVPIYYLDNVLIKKGSYKFKQRHEFENLTLEPGDLVRAWRSMKGDSDDN